MTHYHSLAGGGGTMVSLEGAVRVFLIPLAETEITCRREEDGTANLLIEVSEATCSFKGDDRPHVKFALFGPFLYESVALEPRTTAKTQLVPDEKRFHLIIRCADSEALPRALACFWGSREG